MSEQVIKTVENVDKLFSQIIVNGETFVSDKVVEQPKPVVKPSTKTETTTTASTTPKASRTGEDVYAVDLNDVLHNFTDRTTKQNLTEEIRNRTEKDTVMQTELNTVKTSLNTVKASVEDIQALIPNQATKDNQLADKDFVNSSIATNTANFLGTFNTLEEIEALTDVTNNDYAFWKTTDTVGSVVFKRYKYSADEQLWKFEFDLNNSSFTAEQWEAINSGITAEIVAKIAEKVGKTDIATTIDGKSTDTQVPSAKAVWNKSKNNIQTFIKRDIIAYADSISNEMVTDSVRIMDGTNSPYGVNQTNNDFYYTIYNITDYEFKRILAYDIRENDMYMIMKKKGVWGTWAKLATMDNVDRYSNFETPIGTWVDGKTIYRKVLDVRTNGLGVTGFAINISDLNIDYLVNSNVLGSGHNNYGGNKWVLSCVTATGRHLYIEGATQTLRGQSNEYMQFVILEYTKTTD